ncbi:MAG: phosphatase PAP2 family protein, partial [Acidimicrobiales bacterium]
GPFTSSFPSGHAAADLAFVFGAFQELPRLLLPLSLGTLAVHWSLVRKRAHYPSDVVAGGALGIAVAAAAWVVWPPKGPDADGARPATPVPYAMGQRLGTDASAAHGVAASPG